MVMGQALGQRAAFGTFPTFTRASCGEPDVITPSPPVRMGANRR